MARFIFDETDVEGFIQRDRQNLLRQDGPWSAGALGAAVLLLWVQPLLAAVAFGMGVAWLYLLVKDLRSIRPWYWFDNEVGKGPVAIELRDAGVWTEWAVGDWLLKWSGVSAIRNYPGFFVFEVNGVGEVLILPKRHLSEHEILQLQSKAAEVAGRTQEAAG